MLCTYIDKIQMYKIILVLLLSDETWYKFSPDLAITVENKGTNNSQILIFSPQI